MIRSSDDMSHVHRRWTIPRKVIGERTPRGRLVHFGLLGSNSQTKQEIYERLGKMFLNEDTLIGVCSPYLELKFIFLITQRRCLMSRFDPRRKPDGTGTTQSITCQETPFG